MPPRHERSGRVARSSERGVRAGFDLDSLRPRNAVIAPSRTWIVSSSRVWVWIGGSSPARMRRSTTAHSPPDCSLPTGLLTGDLQLGARAVAGLDGTTSAGTRQNRITHGHLPLLSHRPRPSDAGGQNQSAGRQDAHGYREVQSAGVRSPLVSAGDRETSLGHGVIPLTRRYDLGLRACWQAGDESGEQKEVGT